MNTPSHAAPILSTHAGEAINEIPILDAEREGAVAALEAVGGQQVHAELLQRLLEHPVHGGDGLLGVTARPVVQLRDLGGGEKGPEAGGGGMMLGC